MPIKRRRDRKIVREDMGPREESLFKMWRFECIYILRGETSRGGGAEVEGEKRGDN